MRRAGPDEFWARVDKSGDCWIFTGATDGFGYGFVRRTAIATHMLKAHRYSWMLLKGKIPDGLCVLHKCDNPPCVNPDHLFLGTQLENVVDRHRKNRTSKVSRNVGADHPLSKINEKLVMQIRKFCEGNSQAKAAIHFGMDSKWVHLIVKRKRWKHV